MAAEPDHDLLFAADCPVCGRKGTVVTPDYCSEGHGDQCPDRICVQCGSALAVGLQSPAGGENAPVIRSA